MSRPLIFGIVCCCLFASSASLGWGQDYLDLPDEPSGSGPTLSDRFLSLKDKFRREPKQAKPPAAKSTQRSKPRPPRYRNTTRSSSQAQRARRSAASQQVQKSVPTNRVNGKIVSRPQSNDLLPDTQLFSRGNQPQPRSQALRPKAKQLSRATSLPRASSTKSKPAPQQVARKSPTTSRANELDAALADLLQTKPVRKQKRATVESPKLSTPVANNTFDLRKALLDDEEDTIAAEVAKAADAVADAPVAKAAQPKVVESPEESPEEAAPVIVTKRAIEEILTPVVKAKPVVAEPVVSKPIVVEVPQPKQVITIAQPKQQTEPTTSGARTAPVVNDPFEGAAKQVFSISQQANNPMRSFHPTVVAQAEPVLENPVKAIARPERHVLHTSQQPVIVSHVEGPQSIMVGREATYQITLENTSNQAATDLSAEISVPEWAELVDAMSTSGVVKRSDQGANAGALEWKLNELAPRTSQALRLRLIPRSGRPLQLGVRWSQAPVETQAIVEVQEPKLELAIGGPKEVRYGQAQRYRLTLRNPGTGLTEQISLRLIPPGGDAQSATTQIIGDLKPGEVKDIDLELTAREAGELLIQADAFAEGGLKAETTKTVLCRKPELKVDWRGPDKKYAGTVAAYYFRVSNPGTTATEPVEMSVKLPAGAEFVSASEGYSINTATGIVSWRLAAIDESEEQFMQLRCKIARAGKNDFELIAKTSDGELSDSKAFQTDVVALADLQLEVTDPQGPLPMGESVVYEIRVRNRGTTSAKNINVIGLFSEGIDPTTVEGAQFSLRDGRVSFHPIKNLPAGREVVLRIHAKATRAGTHIFRTEVNCPKLDIKLAAEETTRFFEDENRWEDGETPYTAERQTTLKR